MRETHTYVPFRIVSNTVMLGPVRLARVAKFTSLYLKQGQGFVESAETPLTQIPVEYPPGEEERRGEGGGGGDITTEVETVQVPATS